MNRRVFIQGACSVAVALGLGGLFHVHKYGRVNIHEHGPKWRVWLDGTEVSSECYEADDCKGYVKLFRKNELGKFYYDPSWDDVAREVRIGTVRIERT